MLPGAGGQESWRIQHQLESMLQPTTYLRPQSPRPGLLLADEERGVGVDLAEDPEAGGNSRRNRQHRGRERARLVLVQNLCTRVPKIHPLPSTTVMQPVGCPLKSPWRSTQWNNRPVDVRRRVRRARAAQVRLCSLLDFMGFDVHTFSISSGYLDFTGGLHGR